jgi:hypothetical protein
VGDELDILFATPPAGFIAERKRIVAALKAAGRKDDAKAVEKIPRPSLAVWTVNRIAQLDPQLVRRLGAITERLQKATGPEYGAAAAEHRQALGALRDRAGEVLTAAGQEVGPHIVQRVVANLRAAAGGADTRATLERGRLERDVDASAEQQQDAAAGLFGAMAAALAPGPPAARGRTAPAPVKASKSMAAEAKPAKQAAAEAKAQERARVNAIAAAEREVGRRRTAGAAARKQVEGAERAVAAARKELAAAEDQLATARTNADSAADALAAAQDELARVTAR